MPQHPPHYPPPPSPPQNGFGTAAFVLGLLGLLFSFIPIIGVIAWPLVLLALVFGGIGIAKAGSGRATNRGLAIAGLVCAAFGLLICIVYAAAFSAAVSSTPTATATAPTASARQAGIGTEVQDGAFAFTVTKVDTGVQSLGQSYLRTEAQGSYVLVHVTVRNVGTESQLFTGSNQTLFDAQGREFDADTAAAIMNVPDSESFLTTINPGNSVNGVLVFDVPEGVAPASIELHDSMFSSGVLVSLAG
jgi:hypothetical protein